MLHANLKRLTTAEDQKMASNYESPPSYEEAVNKPSEMLASQLQISINEEPQASSSGPAQSSTSGPTQSSSSGPAQSSSSGPAQSSSSGPAQSSSSGPAQSSSSPSDELQTLLQRHEAAMQDNNLMEQDESTLALAEYYKQAENYDKALQYLKKLYDIRLQMFEPNSLSEEMADVTFHIGVCLHELKQYQQSVEWHRAAMTIWETQGKATLCLARTYNIYAVALSKTGHYNDALKYYEKSMQVRNDLTSGDTEAKAEILCNIGALYRDHISNYNKSLDYYNQALTMYRNIHGTNTPHINVACTLCDIAFTHSKRGDSSSARTFYTEALDQFKEIHHSQPYHDDIERTSSNLGAECYSMRDYSAAEVYYREVVCLRKAKYGKESAHEMLLMAYRQLMKTLKAQNKASEDLASQLQISGNEEPQPSSSGPTQSSSSPSDDLQTLLQRHEAVMQDANLIEQDESTVALAEYYMQAKNYDKALQYFEKLHAIRLQMYGPDSQSEKMADVTFSISLCLNELKRYQQSLEWHRTAISILETHGKPTLGLASAYNNYAVALIYTGHYNNALKYYEKSMQVKNNLISGDTEDKALTLRNIAAVYSDHISNYTKSLDYYNQALTMYRNIHGTNTPHINVAICLHHIACTHSKSKDHLKARSICTKELNQYKEIHQNESYHDDIERATSNLGAECNNMRDYSAAEVYYRELVHIRKVKYGGEIRHEKLLQAYRDLINALKHQNKMEEAREIANIPGIDLSPSELSALEDRNCVLS